MPKAYLNSKSGLHRHYSEINPIIRTNFMVCLLLITLLIPTTVLANDAVMPFGKDLTLNIEVYRKVIEGEYVPFFYLDGEELIKEEWKKLADSSEKQTEVKKAISQYTESMKKKLEALAGSLKNPVAEAFIHYLYGKGIMEKKLDGHEEKAFKEFKIAVLKLSDFKTEKDLETYKKEMGIQPRSLYKQVVESILLLRERISENRNTNNLKRKDVDSWIKEFFSDDYYSKSPFYQDGLAIVKHFQVNYFYDKKKYKKAYDLCKEFLITFPKDENFSKNVKLLKVLEKELKLDTYENFEKRQWYAIFVCCPIVSICLGLLLLLINKRWPEINIMVTHKRWRERRKQPNTPKSNLVKERQGTLCLHYNDPLMYILKPQKNISNFNKLVAKWPLLYKILTKIGVTKLFSNRLFELSFYAFIFMFILHFLFALLDNNLYFDQGGILSGISDLVSGNFEKISKTFFTWPMGHSPSQKEYFFNDYYGLGVNSIINPLICILIFVVYRNFGNVWKRLFEEKILEFKEEQYIDEFFNYAERIFNRRLYFWICFLVSMLTAFWMWYSVYNQPYRDSYLDFGEGKGIVPIYHLLYLALTWYIMAMFAFKTVLAALLIKKLFIEYVGQNKVKLNLKPMHFDGCSGLSYFGGYMIKIQIILFLITLSVFARTILDFIMVGTPIHALPQMFIGFAIYIGFTPLMSILPLYYIRKGIMSAKKMELKKLEGEYFLHQSEFMKTLQDKYPDINKLDYMEKLTIMSSLIKNIPNLPLNYKFLSGYVSSVAIPFVLQVHQLIKLFST